MTDSKRGVFWHDRAVCRLLQVDQLRAEVARYQARLAELENDFLSLDVVANTEVRHHLMNNLLCMQQRLPATYVMLADPLPSEPT
jgi:hypothetical protein